MPKDRDYYRGMDTPELKEQAHYGIDVDWKELAIALSERVEELQRKMDRGMCSKCDDDY